MKELLDRKSFREEVFKRDNFLCVICKSPAQDAHHIIERRLWDDGGYYINNGASLCGNCHMKAETTELSVEQIREAAGIVGMVLPDHLYDEFSYTKWGDIINSDGTRVAGELFHDESVQKVIKPFLHLYKPYIKYPRTYHLPWSLSLTKDDRILKDVSHFEGKRVVVTEKMDGENTTIYTDYLHARSTDSESHPSQNWVRGLAGSVGYLLPHGWRVCGENLYARHSIEYADLSSYFLLFSIWDDRNVCLSWEETEEWAELLGLLTVPVLYRGMWNEEEIRNLYQPTRNGRDSEGYVVRLEDSFHYSQFRKSVAKMVRKNHVSNSIHHWKYQAVIPNKLVPQPIDKSL